MAGPRARAACEHARARPRHGNVWGHQGDWKGNTSQSDDDAHGFYDRSLGAIGNDPQKPYQLASADNTALGGGKTGKLATHYDASGNLTRLELERDAAACLPAGAECSQVFVYRWDEVGRLVEARRWDVGPSALDDDEAALGVPDVLLRYSYDAGDQRVLKTAVDGAGGGRAACARRGRAASSSARS